jgi:hypothetical protein
MLAFTFTRKLRPMIIGSSSGWRMLAGRMARPAADLVAHEFRRHTLAQGHETHLLGDFASPRTMHLGKVDVPTHGSTGHPWRAQLGQPLAHIAVLRSGGVVHANRRLAVRQD